ncbi:unnamed protein product [Phaeothamnion confervicola]
MEGKPAARGRGGAVRPMARVTTGPLRPRARANNGGDAAIDISTLDSLLQHVSCLLARDDGDVDIDAVRACLRDSPAAVEAAAAGDARLAEAQEALAWLERRLEAAAAAAAAATAGGCGVGAVSPAGDLHNPVAAGTGAATAALQPVGTWEGGEAPIQREAPALVASAAPAAAPVAAAARAATASASVPAAKVAGRGALEARERTFSFGVAGRPAGAAHVSHRSRGPSAAIHQAAAAAAGGGGGSGGGGGGSWSFGGVCFSGEAGTDDVNGGVACVTQRGGEGVGAGGEAKDADAVDNSISGCNGGSSVGGRSRSEAGGNVLGGGAGNAGAAASSSGLLWQNSRWADANRSLLQSARSMDMSNLDAAIAATSTVAIDRSGAVGASGVSNAGSDGEWESVPPPSPPPPSLPSAASFGAAGMGGTASSFGSPSTATAAAGAKAAAAAAIAAPSPSAAIAAAAEVPVAAAAPVPTAAAAPATAAAAAAIDAAAAAAADRATAAAAGPPPPKVVSTVDTATPGFRWLGLRKVVYRDAGGVEREWEACFRTTKPASEESGGVDAVYIVAHLTSAPPMPPPLQSADTRGPAGAPAAVMAVPPRTATPVAAAAAAATAGGGDALVVVKQFRPPVGRPTLEFPAGLVDDGETCEEAAVRELQEETGFAGSVIGSSPTTYCEPGMTDACCRFVHLRIDGAAAANVAAVAAALANSVAEAVVAGSSSGGGGPAAAALAETAAPEEDEHIETLLVPLSRLASELDRFAAAGCAVDGPLYAFALGLQGQAPQARSLEPLPPPPSLPPAAAVASGQAATAAVAATAAAAATAAGLAAVGALLAAGAEVACRFEAAHHGGDGGGANGIAGDGSVSTGIDGDSADATKTCPPDGGGGGAAGGARVATLVLVAAAALAAAAMAVSVVFAAKRRAR